MKARCHAEACHTEAVSINALTAITLHPQGFTLGPVATLQLIHAELKMRLCISSGAAAVQQFTREPVAEASLSAGCHRLSSAAAREQCGNHFPGTPVTAFWLF
jgi:hypothetical protein